MTTFNETKQVYWIITGEINLGQEADFRAICARLVESTKTEPGALNYEWSIAEDSRTFHIYERYADSEAVKFHRGNVGEMLKELYAIATLKSFTLYGGPSDELKQLLATRHPLMMAPHNGFSRSFT
jgi:(4S)-4-hydroxy-5-phosphonooxypentane-2,3-dione isomerase